MDAAIEKPSSGASENEISLLDLVVMVAENWLWLVLVSLGASVAAYLLVAFQPAQYKASALVPAPTSAVVAFLEKTEGQVALEDDGTVAAPLALTNNGLVISAVAGGEASELSMISTAPEAAKQRLTNLSKLIQKAINSGEIPSAEKIYAESVSKLEAMVALRSMVIERLGAALTIAPTMDEPRDFALTAIALAQLLNGQATEIDRLQELRKVGVDFSIEAPLDSVSLERLGRSPLQIALLVAGGVGFLMLILIFVRQGLADATKNPEARSKLDRIRNGLLLRKSRPSR